jgi:lysophospholipase L1-like esterase
VPKPAGVFRILALGDSYTMGVGVHERDVFESRLEELLNARSGGNGPSARRYEVVNCGVSGYATREERILFETIAADYQPDLVLLLPVFNDDMSWVDEVKAGLIDTGSRPQPLFAAQGLVERARRERTYDYTRSMDELLRLDALVRQQGARLVVAPFRNEESAPWDGLLQALAATLRGTDIPYHDLGPALLRDPGRDLKVHPIDGHPNEVAHRLAAEELLQFLQAQHLLP